MRQPACLESLVEMGIIQEVVRPLMSGKEAQIYLVVSDDELRVAKVYKAAQNRSFRQRAEYTEGRAVRNTRTQRAMNKRSNYGRAQDEASWRSAEVDIIYKLRAAGVRVPEPYHFIDGVLVMELVTGADGEPAPRLADVTLDRAERGVVFETLLSSVVKMLCAGVVHGDLSEFNVLLGHDGPVVIDFPQAVDAARNQSARKLLIRDIDNLSHFLARSGPGKRRLPYGQELWDLYARAELTHETKLTGRFRSSQKKADTSSVLREVEDVAREAQKRREAQGPSRRRRRRRSKPAPEVTIITRKASPAQRETATPPPQREAANPPAPPRSASPGGPPKPEAKKASPAGSRRRRSRGRGRRGRGRNAGEAVA